MATLLESGKSVTRAVRVYGVEALVLVTMTERGLLFRVKGSKTTLNVTWPEAVAASITSENVPSAFYGKPYEFLVRSAKKLVERRQRRADKQAK